VTQVTDCATDIPWTLAGSCARTEQELFLGSIPGSDLQSKILAQVDGAGFGADPAGGLRPREMPASSASSFRSMVRPPLRRSESSFGPPGPGPRAMPLPGAPDGPASRPRVGGARARPAPSPRGSRPAATGCIHAPARGDQIKRPIRGAARKRGPSGEARGTLETQSSPKFLGVRSQKQVGPRLPAGQLNLVEPSNNKTKTKKKGE